MKKQITQILSWLTDQLLCCFAAFVTGVRSKNAAELDFPPGQYVYYANHSSHGDFLLVWIALPQYWRRNVRPVAAADYWLGSPIRRFIIKNVFNGILIDRKGGDNPLKPLQEALAQGDSLIIFPEGTRNTDENTPLLPFKSGVYWLAAENLGLRFVPIWIHNIQNVLPKGKYLPVPMICDVLIGSPTVLQEAENKTVFIARLRSGLLALKPQHGGE